MTEVNGHGVTWWETFVFIVLTFTWTKWRSAVTSLIRGDGVSTLLDWWNARKQSPRLGIWKREKYRLLFTLFSLSLYYSLSFFSLFSQPIDRACAPCLPFVVMTLCKWLSIPTSKLTNRQQQKKVTEVIKPIFFISYILVVM